MDVRNDITMAMMSVLDDNQMQRLKNVLDMVLYNYDIKPKTTELAIYDSSNTKIINKYIGCKRLEGLSEKTLKQYHFMITKFIEAVGKPVKEIDAYDIRFFLASYQQGKEISNRTLVNYQRYISGFFAWLVNEEIITSNPMQKIGKIKTPKVIKQPFTDEELEKLRQCATSKRDRALIEFLYSTACRVSEVVGLNRADINRFTQTMIVRGKGNKEREVYITSKAMFYLLQYEETRTDNDPALFVSKNGRITKDGIEYIIKKIGEAAGVEAYPHKFRRTISTELINKGMPVQEVQKMLGHESLDTTMIYCTVKNDSVKSSHQKFA